MSSSRLCQVSNVFLMNFSVRYVVGRLYIKKLFCTFGTNTIFILVIDTTNKFFLAISNNFATTFTANHHTIKDLSIVKFLRCSYI